MIANSIRTVNETEDVGNEIAAELSRNREKIESSHTKVSIMDIFLISHLSGMK